MNKPKKVRKGQSEEEFLRQKQQFQEHGPTVNTENWLHDPNLLENLSGEKKTDRQIILHSCEKAYFHRNYTQCLALVEKAESLFGLSDASGKFDKDIANLLDIKQRCIEKLAIHRTDQ